MLLAMVYQRLTVRNRLDLHEERESYIGLCPG